MSHKNSNGSSPTTTNGTTSGGGANGDLKYEARLCHVVKRADFDGYGFNLHAEKGRPGQYIGKVDDGSPAESAGLRQGDRIIEVNGTNITNETHKKVVELIKAIPNETKLLVIDPRADAAELKAAIAKAGTKQQQQPSVDVNDNSKQKVANGKDSLNDKSPVVAASPTKPTQNKHDVNGSSNGTTATKEDANNKKNANNNVDTSANKMMMTNGDASAAATKQQQQVDQIIEDTKALSVKAAEANGKPQNGSSNGGSTVTDSGSKEGPKLNLNMTAAELRAQLASRKKYDPKSEVTDLRKKYEIIQKM